MNAQLYSLLSYDPGWRYFYATKKPIAEARELKDKVLNEFLDAQESQNFSDFPKLDCAISMEKRSRGQVEALALGGATPEEIAQCTRSDIEVVNYILKIYFDIAPIAGEPLLRMNIANQETDKYIRSFKVFAAKYGWKKLLQTYFRKDEFLKEAESSLTPRVIFEDLLFELSRKITEVGTYSTGTNQSKELVQWMKLTLDTCRELLKTDTDDDKSKDSDISTIMEHIGKNEKLVFSRESLEFIGDEANPKRALGEDK
jgi:aromatic ring-cleaving dioxygenase